MRRCDEPYTTHNFRAFRRTEVRQQVAFKSITRTYIRCACGARKGLKYATCSDCRTESGSSNSNWRGGRTRHKRGYILLWAPEHPRTGNGSYVFEHVLVMEEMLGRLLLPGENVHHRNGVKDDNRPENLELWIRPQPTSIRISDALAWAREIIARYGDENLANKEGGHQAAF